MLKSTKLYQELQKRESKYLEIINKIYEYAVEMLPKINRIFANYTGHGVEHSVNVMDYMYDLVTDISKMSDLEITCLIGAALFHDIGMAANEEEIGSIKRDELIYHGRKYSVIYDKYQDENIALQECVRPVHGERAYHHIMQMEKEFFVIPQFTNCNFQEELAKICQAHTMNQEWLLQNLDYSQVKGKDELNAQYVAMLLRVADYLDIDERRAPIELYRFLAPVGFGDEEWRQHYIIENREKVVKDDASGSSSIVLYGNCNDAKIHRKFSDLCSEGLEGKRERIYVTYDFHTGKLCLKDAEGEELKKYIENNHMMALKIQGIRKEEKASFEVWKQWHTRIDFPPSEILKSIIFPIKYDDSLCEYCEKGGYYYGESGVFWHSVSTRIVKDIFGDNGINEIMRQCKLLTDWTRIELGIAPIISVGNDRYIECHEKGLGAGYEDIDETYWHSIRLERAVINPDIRIIGVYCGKCIINISNKDISPNVARDRLTDDVKKLVTLAVEKAALQYIVSNLTEDKELQTALQTYINNNYPEDNPYYARNDI